MIMYHDIDMTLTINNTVTKDTQGHKSLENDIYQTSQTIQGYAARTISV